LAVADERIVRRVLGRGPFLIAIPFDKLRANGKEPKDWLKSVRPELVEG